MHRPHRARPPLFAVALVGVIAIADLATGCSPDAGGVASGSATASSSASATAALPADAPSDCYPPTGAPPPQPPATPDMRRCFESRDCVVVTYGCCGSCNGGYVAVSKTQAHRAAEAAARHRAWHCRPTCTALGTSFVMKPPACAACPEVEAACEAGQCVGTPVSPDRSR